MNGIAIIGYYSMLADDTTDVSNTRQLVVCIRWTTKDLEVEEDFIGRLSERHQPIQAWLTWCENNKNNSDPDSCVKASG